MADVYLAVNRKNGRRIALKLVERGEVPDVQEVMTAERLGAQLQQRIGAPIPGFRRSMHSATWTATFSSRWNS